MLRAAPTTKRGGVNIVGPFEGTSVEADVARRLASALRAGGVPISTTSYHRDHRDLGSAWSHHGSSDFPFDVNLLVVHPDHMTDFVLDSGPGLVPRSLHDRVVGVGSAGAVVRQWPTRRAWCTRCGRLRLRGHGSASIGVRRACPRRPHPGRTGADCGGTALHSACRMASSSRPASTSTAGSPVRTRSEPCRRTPRAFSPRDGHHLVIDASHADRYPQEHALLVGLADGRPDVAIRHGSGPPPSGTASWRRPTATSRSTGPTGGSGRWPKPCRGARSRWSPQRRSPWSSRAMRTVAWSAPKPWRFPPTSTAIRPARRGPIRTWSTPVPCCGPWWMIRTPPRSRSGGPGEVATRRFLPSAAVGAVHSRLADIDARLHAGHRRDRVAADRVRDHAGQATLTSVKALTSPQRKGRARGLRCPTPGRPRVRAGDCAGPAAPVG